LAATAGREFTAYSGARQALEQLRNQQRLLSPIICRQQPRQIPFNFRASSFSLLAVSAASLFHSGEPTVGVVAPL